MRLSIGEAARRAGVSVRALRYYDRIGLLTPSETTDAGYRYYDADAMARLQQILFYKELGMPLEQIGRVLDSPEADRMDALRKHRRLLEMKRDRIEDMLRLADETIGGSEMYEERPVPSRLDYEKLRDEYAREAEERWGDTEAFRESASRRAGRSDEDVARMRAEMEDIFQAFVACSDPEGDEGAALAKRWQDHISAYHYVCTDEILRGLAEMYEKDPRFAANLEAYGPGTAMKMSAAIRASLERRA